LLSDTSKLVLSRRSVLLGALTLSGCGLAPVYGTQGTATPLRGAIAVTAPETVAGYRLRARFTERFGHVGEARYFLVVTMTQAPTPATITTDGDTTRFNLVGTANWTLNDAAGAPLKAGTVETFTSYSATGSTVATQASETDAEARLSTALADLIVARLIIAAPEFTP
tara:strand:+ start:21632 stop:22135 length:504 start_codon:yes stop_codon:yes gene_type:complete